MAVVPTSLIKIPFSHTPLLALIFNFPYFYKNVDNSISYPPLMNYGIMDFYFDLEKITIDIDEK